MSFKRHHRRHGQPLPQPREWPPGDTKTTLVADLEGKPPGVLRDRLIQRAKAGRYHDFETELATPKVALYRELLDLGYDDLAQKVRDGGYDHERPTFEQTSELRDKVLREQLGSEAYDAMKGEKGRGKS